MNSLKLNPTKNNFEILKPKYFGYMQMSKNLQ